MVRFIIITESMMVAQTLMLLDCEDVLPIPRADVEIVVDWRDLTFALDDFSERYLEPVVERLGYGISDERIGPWILAAKAIHAGQVLSILTSYDMGTDQQLMRFELRAV